MAPNSQKTRRLGPEGIRQPTRRCARALSPLIAAAALMLAASSGLCGETKWDPIDPADLAAKDSKSSPGADAEVLISRNTLDNTYSDLVAKHYIRAKLFTRKGVEDQGKLFIESPFATSVKEIAARVAKSDGTVIELKKADILESTALKYGNVKWQRYGFAFPNLMPGDIVEYRWEERVDVSFAFSHYFTFLCQHRFPVREFKLTVEGYPRRYQVLWFNCSGAVLEETGGHQMVLTVRNLPPFEEEQDMPPERDFSAWAMVLGAAEHPDYQADQQWEWVSEYWEGKFRERTRSGGAIKELAAKLTGGADSDVEKLRRLYEYCQKEIVNFDWADTPDLQEAKNKNQSREEPQTAAQTLSKRQGSRVEVDYLFAGLARAAGFEVKLARNASRAELLNVRGSKGFEFLTNQFIAVKTGGQWQFYDPGQYLVPFGMLTTEEEGVTALLCDANKVILENAPISPAGLSRNSRKGRFTLDEEGTLEGTVEQSLTGHLAIEIKADHWKQAADEVDRDFRARITKRLPTAEISDIHWDNLRTRELPVSVRYHVRVPGYAEQAGKRLVLAPGFFVAGEPARFTAEKRKYPVLFHHTWAEQDDIEIVLPEGFELEAANAPLDVGKPEVTCGATFEMGYKPKQRILMYKRNFALGANGAIVFRPEIYSGLKRLFESLHQSNAHSIMLRRTAPSSTGSADAGAPATEATSRTAP